MATGYLSPIGMIVQLFTDQGVVGLGYKINTYVGGSVSTPQQTWTDSTLTVLNSNPIVMGSNGRFQSVSVWGPAGTLIKMVITDALNTPIAGGTIDNIPLINDATSFSVGLNPQTPAELAASITPTNYLYPAGYINRYFTNTTPGTTDATAAFTAAIAQGQQSGGATITVNDKVAIASNVTLPAGVSMTTLANANINIASGKILTLTGFFYAGRTTAFTGAGTVVLGDGCCDEVFPEWWGAKNDSNVTASSGTDSTAAINACFTACAALNAGVVSALVSVRFDAGFYRCGTINTMCPSMAIRGRGRWTTAIVCNTGTTGIWWQENANGAAKIILEDFALYCNNLAGLTYGLRLGYVNNNSPHGTEGYLRGLLIRDVPNGTGLDCKGNVSFADLISVYSCQNHISFTGTGNIASKLVAIGAANPGTMVLLNQCNVHNLEIEAPVTGALPLSIQAPCVIDGLFLSGADGTTLSHWIEMGVSIGGYAIKGVVYYFGVANTTIVTNGNIKRGDGSFFGGNATGSGSGGISPHGGEGSYFSETAGMKHQSFHVRLTNNTGTLQHRIGDTFGGATNLASLITGATNATNTTPLSTAADASTPFTAGAKISSVQSNALVLASQGWPSTSGTNTQRISDSQLTCALAINNSGTAGLTVSASFQSFNINGVTRNYLNFTVWNAGAAYPLTAANITGYLDFSFDGYLSP